MQVNNARDGGDLDEADSSEWSSERGGILYTDIYIYVCVFWFIELLHSQKCKVH